MNINNMRHSVVLLLMVVIYTGCNNTQNETIETIDINSMITEEVTEAVTEKITEDVIEKVTEVVDEVHQYMISQPITLVYVANNNQINDNGNRHLLIQLPPSYYDTNFNFPVVYFFHGYSQSENSVCSYLKQTTKMMQEGTLKEMIIVSVSQTNTYGIVVLLMLMVLLFAHRLTKSQIILLHKSTVPIVIKKLSMLG